MRHDMIRKSQSTYQNQRGVIVALLLAQLAATFLLCNLLSCHECYMLHTSAANGRGRLLRLWSFFFQIYNRYMNDHFYCINIQSMTLHPFLLESISMNLQKGKAQTYFFGSMFCHSAKYWIQRKEKEIFPHTVFFPLHTCLLIFLPCLLINPRSLHLDHICCVHELAKRISLEWFPRDCCVCSHSEVIALL